MQKILQRVKRRGEKGGEVREEEEKEKEKKLRLLVSQVVSAGQTQPPSPNATRFPR